MEVAEATGLHPVTARRQLNRVLAGESLLFRCDVAQDYSGYPVQCQWFASLPPNDRRGAVDALRGFRELRLCASTTGTSNLTFTMWLGSPAEVLDIEDHFLSAVPWASVVKPSLVVIRPAWGICHPGDYFPRASGMVCAGPSPRKGSVRR